MTDDGYVVWPEGQPHRARFVRSWFACQWLKLGPFGLASSFRGRRMSSLWPAPANLPPVRLAEEWEARIRTLQRDIADAITKFSGASH